MADGTGQGQEDRSRVNVVLRLSGMQDIAVVAHDPGTEQARVSVRIGRALLYFRDWSGTAAVARGWRALSGDAARLPAVAGPDPASVGVLQAAVAIEVLGTPRVVGMLRAQAGLPGQLMVTIDQLGLVIQDRRAFATTRQAFLDAERLSEQTLPRPAAPDLREVAAARVERALAAPPRRPVPRPASTPINGPRPGTSGPRSTPRGGQMERGQR